MAFHIPFSQRHSARRQAPIFIGFEVPAPPMAPRRKFNWWGFHGMWLSFASLLTAGFLSPIPLLISLVGLRRPGRKMATVGALTSLGGIGLAVALVFSSIAVHNHRNQERHQVKQSRTIVKQVNEVKSLLSLAAGEITQYRDDNEGELPNDIDANMLVIKHVDPWGESLRFDAEVDHAIIRSAGPDKEFNTQDDVTSKIKGKTDREPLLPIAGDEDSTGKSSSGF